ncbi:PAS-domain containing protein [Roseovarius rhodophyticola]|uniref:histidine kinase n=1 Tax=Roseovarius rhodophyticola TaxID=3080827 RepID=A0ABZ2TBZ4_9RHOB
MSQTDKTQMTIAGLNLIQQALTIYDRDLHLAVCNRRFQEMFDLPMALVTPGAQFADTIRYLAERGDYGDVGDVDHFVADRVEIARAFEPHYMERTRASGRIISVEGSPLPEGGWVTVYTDITKTRRQEELLSTRSEELSDQLVSYSQDLTSANRKLEATITALEEAKRQITEAEARMRLTTEMVPAHIAHIGPDWRYTYSNRRLSVIMPGTQANPVGLTPKTALGEQPFAILEPHLKNAFDGAPGVFEFTHEESSRRIRVALTPDRATGGVYILSMDITEEAQTRAALQQTRRREMAAQLTSGLAHDFSNLLTIILGMQSRLQIMALPEDGAELIAATINAARRGGSLLNRIADMTGPRDYTPQAIDIPGFLSDLSTLVISTLPEDVVFETINAVGQRTCLLDPGMLQDSLLNLAINARDACGDTGNITLRIETIQDTWIDFIMQDTGAGFSEKALAHAFDPFFTTKGGEGSGLGLTMVYDMTKLAGGRVILANHTAGGSVTLRLPFRATDRIDAPGLVLLVEDSPDLRDSIRDMLRDAGHNVIEASNVPEAITLAQNMPEITAILSDISLEGEETGLDLIKALSGDTRPVFLITSLPKGDPLHRAARQIAPVMRKPFHASALEEFLKSGVCA